MIKFSMVFLSLLFFVFSLSAEVVFETDIISYNDLTPVYGPFEALLMNEIMEGKSSNSFFETWNSLVEDIKKKETINFNELKYIERAGGTAGTNIFEDRENITWFVKTGQNPHTEYLASRLMQLMLGGDVTPCVKLIFKMPGKTASRAILGFEIGGDNHASEKWIERDIAIAFIGLSDPNSGNIGVVEKNGRKYAARVDYDHAFYYTGRWLNGTAQGAFHLDTSGYTRVIKDAIQHGGGSLDEVIDAIEAIIRIPDSALENNFYSGLMALYIVNPDLDFEKYQQLMIGLLERKKALSEVKERLLIVKNFLNEPSLDSYAKAQEIMESGLFGELSLDIVVIKVTGSLTIIDWMLNNGFLEKERLNSLIFEKGNLNRQEIRYFLDKGVDINAVGSYGAMVLKNAVLKKDKELVTLLLEEGADINASPALLRYAVWKGDLEFLKFLIAHGAKNVSKDLLCSAVDMEDVAKVELLLDEFFNFGDIVLDRDTCTYNLPEMHNLMKGSKYPNFVLDTAIALGKTSFVATILKEEKGTRDKNTDNSFLKALQIYESSGEKNDMFSVLLTFLIYNRVDINIRDNAGETYLHKAVKFGDEESVKFLLSINGIDADAVNLKGERPSDLTEDAEIKRLLAEKESMRLFDYFTAGANWFRRHLP